MPETKANENEVVLNEERLEGINEKMEELKAEIPEEDMKILKENMLDSEKLGDVAGGLSGKAKTALIGLGSLAVGVLGAGVIGKHQVGKVNGQLKEERARTAAEKEKLLDCMVELSVRHGCGDTDGASKVLCDVMGGEDVMDARFGTWIRKHQGERIGDRIVGVD